MQVIGFNTGCKCSTIPGLMSTVSIIEESYPQWDIIVLTEADAVASSTFEKHHPLHRTYRYWPGEGSRAMSFIVHRRFHDVVVRFSNRDRAALLELTSPAPGNPSVAIIGVHGPHTCQREFLCGVSHLMSCRQGAGPLLIIGDWNVNLANSHQIVSGLGFQNLVSPEVEPEAVQNDRVSDLCVFVRESSLDFSFASRIDDCPGPAVWRDACRAFPYTRVPLGCQPGSPSLIDFAVANKGSVKRAMGTWRHSPSDHCILRYDIACSFLMSKRSRSHFVCADWDNAVRYARLCWPLLDSESTSERASSVCAFLKDVVTRFQVGKSAAQRRSERLPFSLRMLYRRLDLCHDNEREALRAQCWRQRLIWLKALRTEALKRRVDRGGVVSSRKKLFPVRSLSVSSGPISDDHGIAHACASSFSDKFGSKLLQLRSNVLDFARESEGHSPPFGELDVAIALEKLRRPSKLDRDGLCVDVLCIAFEAAPDKFVSWLSDAVSSEEFMKSQASPMYCFGKHSSHTSIKHLRGLIPPNTFLRLTDFLLSSSLQNHLLRIIPKIPGVFVGAQRYTQVRDLGHSLALLVEKGVDDHGCAAMAQGDIARFFDSLSVLRILNWLRVRGVDVTLLAAIARHQLLTGVYVCRAGVRVFLKPRARGGLTGSTTAMILGRIPVESAFADLYPTCALRGFPVQGCRVVFGSWVDNVYCASQHPSDAYKNLLEVFEYLRKFWDLDLKDGSVSVLVSDGYDVTDFVKETNIPVCDHVVALGWRFYRNGSLSRVWAEVVRMAWGVFQANLRTRGSRALGPSRRVALVERAIKPLIVYKLQPFAAVESYVNRLRRLQRVMVSRALGNYQLSTEDYKTFCARCSADAKRIIGVAVPDWGSLWISSTLSWDAHLARDFADQQLFLSKHPQDDVRLVLRRDVWDLASTQHIFSTSFSWAPLLSRHRTASWFDNIRTIFRVGHRTSSRTSTRACRGFVHPRWHDAVEWCKSMSTSS